jgi:hypothetical protein
MKCAESDGISDPDWLTGESPVEVESTPKPPLKDVVPAKLLKKVPRLVAMLDRLSRDPKARQRAEEYHREQLRLAREDIRFNI